MSEHKHRIMQDIPIFATLSDATLGFLLDRSTEVHRRKGEVFIKEGDVAYSLFILQSGQAIVLKHWDGNQYQIGSLNPGDCFGEVSLMDIHPRSAGVLAVQDSVAFEIGAPAVIELCQHDLSQFTILQMNLAREISRRLRNADEQIFRYRMVPNATTRELGYREFVDISAS